MNRKAWVVSGLVVMAIVAAGCSKPPTAAVQAADQALDAAKAADAADYAPASFKAAEDARSALETELKAQEDHFALTRSYKTAAGLAERAKAAADQAVADANTGKEQAREESATLIADVKKSLEEVKGLLEKAPRGKGSAMDIAMLKSDLSGIESALGETEASFNAEDYAQSKTQAEAAKQNVESIRDEILRAMETRRSSRTRRG